MSTPTAQRTSNTAGTVTIVFDTINEMLLQAAKEESPELAPGILKAAEEIRHLKELFVLSIQATTELENKGLSPEVAHAVISSMINAANAEKG